MLKREPPPTFKTGVFYEPHLKKAVSYLAQFPLFGLEWQKRRKIWSVIVSVLFFIAFSVVSALIGYILFYVIKHIMIWVGPVIFLSVVGFIAILVIGFFAMMHFYKSI